MVTTPENFESLGLNAPILQALKDIGYESPSPIQAAAIPCLQRGVDIVGQAQTGTGKTAAFALPLLNQLDLSLAQPQILVLTPTRELAIQVAEAFQAYARHLKGFHVVPIYGGQNMGTQLRLLKRGAHVIIGTPGRVMDHLRRNTLPLSAIKSLVLDEADEMLNMGFLEDVEWILEQTPPKRQVALFSATMPKAIRDIARRHLHDP
jgi:ATP-dependent RNA helicase DeaD